MQWHKLMLVLRPFWLCCKDSRNNSWLIFKVNQADQNRKEGNSFRLLSSFFILISSRGYCRLKKIKKHLKYSIEVPIKRLRIFVRISRDLACLNEVMPHVDLKNLIGV